MSRTYLTTLTPLRGIAALLVVIFHSNLMLVAFLPPFEAHFITAGWLWVDFFFVLSGFIIAYVYGQIFKDGVTRASYWTYLKARFARVYPLHFVTLIWCLICSLILIDFADGIAPFFAAMLNPWSALPSLFLAQSLGVSSGVAPLNTPSWSLSTEWWVYMIFPFIMPLFHRLKIGGRALAFAAITALFLGIKYYLSPLSYGGPPSLNVLTDFGIFRCLAGFLLGMLLFTVYKDSIGVNLFRKSWVFVALCVGLVIAMHVGVEDILIVPFFPLIILAAAYNQSTVKKGLDTSILQRLGDWSFSIYMVHVPIMYLGWIYQVKLHPTMLATFPPPPQPINAQEGLIACAVAVVLTLVVASLTYKYVEVPARNYLNSRFKSKEFETVKMVN